MLATGPHGRVSSLAERIGPDGDLLVIEESVERLEELQRSGTAPNVFYLLGDAVVLPMLDGSVDEILSTVMPTEAAAAEFFRVLRSGGRLGIGASDQDQNAPALKLDPDEARRLLQHAGFDRVTVSTDGSSVTARKP